MSDGDDSDVMVAMIWVGLLTFKLKSAFKGGMHICLTILPEYSVLQG